MLEELVLEVPAMSGVKRGWIGKEDDRCLYFRMDVPGFGKQHIKVTMDNNTNTLVIQGEMKDNQKGISFMDGHTEVGRRKYSAKISIPPGVFNTDGIKSDVTNGVVKVMVPKTKVDGRRYIDFNVPKKSSEEQENPFLVQQQGVRKSWWIDPSNIELGERSLLVRIDMPGLDQNHVKGYWEDDDDDVFVIEGKGNKESDEYEAGGTRHIRFKVDTTDYLDHVIIHVRHGVCLIAIPARDDI